MRKIKAGEWFQFRELPALRVTLKPDCDGDCQIAIDKVNGEFESRWFNAAYLDECERFDRAPWKSFPKATRGRGGFRFHAFYSPNGRRALVVAGCRAFTVAQAKRHWKNRCCFDGSINPERQAANDWSLAYVAKLEAHLRLVRAGKAT